MDWPWPRVYSLAMFIRRTTIKSRESGEPYYSYRLDESVRSGAGVHQHTSSIWGASSRYPDRNGRPWPIASRRCWGASWI